LIGVAIDPLKGHAAKGNQMGVLLIIMFATLGLGLRANAASRRTRVAGSETSDEIAIIDSYARTSLLVLLCLLGLLALGLTYGNVLGAVAR
jgi:hypothetical protein